MLQLLLGRSGCGKSETMVRTLSTLAAGDAPLFLIVPEQFSFENERALLERLGPSQAARITVLSFTRLAETVFREVGGSAVTCMDTSTRTLLMCQALQEVQDELTLYRRHTASPDYIASLLTMVSEAKRCRIAPSQWAEAAAAVPGETLRQKVRELSVIFAAYDALAAQAELLDPDDRMTVLTDRISASRLFIGAQVFVDSFEGFTAQEMEILCHILRQADTVTVSLCTDTLQENGTVPGRFSSVTRTAQALIQTARDNGVVIAPVRYLTKNFRVRNDALRALEAQCLTAEIDPFPEETDAVTIIPCRSALEECRFAARTVRRILRENGGFSRDFTIVMRDTDTYQKPLTMALAQEEIPFCVDDRQPIASHPLTVLLQSVLETVTGGWNSEDILRAVKTGLLGFSVRSSSLIENYLFMWRINGRRFLTEWDGNPDGISGEITPETTARLHLLNLYRRRLVGPLSRLSDRLSGTVTGVQFARAVTEYLKEARVARMVRMQVRRLEANGQPDLSENEARLWDILMEILNRFARVFPRTVLPAARFTELFSTIVAATDFGTIPQTLDGVRIGGADRIRYTAPRTVLILGANEGVFPAYPTINGLLTAWERSQLLEGGLPISDLLDKQTASERYFAYLALSAASERLIVTYKTDSGVPSVLVQTIDRVLPYHAVGTAMLSATTAESDRDVLTLAADNWHCTTPEEVTLQAFLRRNSENEARLSAIARSADNASFAFSDPAAAQRFFGDSLRLSPSQVETFYQCRFFYFCQYGLRIKPLEPAELSGLESGTLIHYLLEHLLKRYADQGFATVTEEQVKTDTASVIAEYVNDYLGGMDNKPKRMQQQIQQLSRIGAQVMWRIVLELRQSRFIPADYELPIGSFDENGDGIAPWVITLPDGGTVSVRGKADRVDIYRASTGDNYIRIIDYKSFVKTFSLSEIMDGINLQMLIYLMSIWQNGAPRYGTVKPAGIFYLPAILPVIRESRGAAAEELAKKRTAALSMKGLYLDNPEVISAMEADVAGVFIPAKMKKDGSLSASEAMITLQQFGLLKRKIERLLTAMAEELHQGHIGAVPATDGESSGCAYCQFGSICGHEEGAATRPLRHDSKDAIMTELEQETEEGEDVHAETPLD